MIMSPLHPFPGGITRTPRAFVVLIAAVAWWGPQPWLAERYYSLQLGRGAYPPEADSIMIPIGQAWMSWLLLTPLVGGLTIWALRHYRLGVPTLTWHLKRPWFGAMVSLLAALAIAAIADSAVADYRDGYLVLALPQVIGILVVLWLRAGALGKATPSFNEAAA